MKLFKISYESILKSLFWAKARLSWIFNLHAKAWGKYRNTNNIQSNTYPVIYGGDLKNNQKTGVSRLYQQAGQVTPFWSGFIFIAITLLISCSEKTINEDQLQNRDGVFYEVNAKKPFSGTVIEKYRDGQVKEEMHYKDGEGDGHIIQWYENGQKKREENWKDGKQHGHFTGWYENGQKWFEQNYKDGEIQGLSNIWHENGQKRYEINYKRGEEISTVEWDENGNEIK